MKDRIKESDDKSEKLGFLKRFLEWLAKGADKASKTYCPT